MSIGLALSGGGAKGAAHIGVLEALRDNNIKVDYISGASSGSIIAAMFAAGYTPNEILRIITKHTKNKSIIDYDKAAPFKLMKLIFSKKINLSGFIKGDKIEYLIKEYLKYKNILDISDFSMPIAIPVVDVRTGEVVYYINGNNKKEKIYSEANMDNKSKHYDDEPQYRYSGNISEIIRASISFPGVFRPKEIDSNIYIDGGVRVNTPVNILKQMGADKVIAVSFDCNKIDKNNLKSIIGITSQAFDILTHEASEQELFGADVNIRICAKNVSLLDFSKSAYLAKRGYYMTHNNINYIKRKIGIEL